MTAAMESHPRRVRHPLPAARWPGPAEAAASRWFSPVRLGPGVVARTRTWVPAMVPWRASAEGFVTGDVLDWYGRFAEGRPGTLVVEATGIRDVPSGPLLRIGHDRFVPGLSDIARVVRERSDGATCLLIQILDFLAVRRRPEPRAYFERFLTIRPAHREALAAATGDGAWADAPEAAVRGRLATLDDEALRRILSPREIEDLRRGYRERVTDTDLPHIRDLPQILPGLFAAAARRAREAGFHGVELHCAHAYTLASFLSRLNTRADGFGGSLENRSRLPLRVLEAVRQETGPDFVVGVRFLGDEVVEGGSRVEDARAFAVAFARAGADVLSVSKGGKFEDAREPRIGEAAYPYTGPSGLECMPTVWIGGDGPFGRNIPLAAAVREAVRAAGLDTPVVASGGIATFDEAEGILARGEADIVAAARQTLADPDWFRKIALGRGAEVRRCSFTNYCEGLDQRHRQVTCRLWDRDFAAGDDVRLADDGRRRLVAPRWTPRDGGDQRGA